MIQVRAPFVLLACLGAVIALPGCGDVAARSRAPSSEFRIPTPLEIEVTGSAFHWHVLYPGADGLLGTDDDVHGRRDVHLPQNAQARVHLRSKDYVYTMSFPQLGLKEIAVPDLEFSLAVQALEKGVFELRGNQMCGFTHPNLLGRLVVHTAGDYAAEMDRLRVN